MLLTLGVQAQKRDTLPLVHVKEKRTAISDIRFRLFTPGAFTSVLDSATLSRYKLQNVSDLLTRETPVYIRSYAQNGLATVTFRGASSAQSQVLWNGVPLQNPATGVADLSILPVGFMDRVAIVYGGSGSLSGSGNVGGALLLEQNSPVFDSFSQRLGASVAAGNFGLRAVNAGYRLSGKKISFSIKGTSQHADNDFTYLNDSGKHVRMPNSRFGTSGVLASLAIKTGTYSYLDVSLWLQVCKRQIPPALFERSSNRKQDDNSIRSLVGWYRKRKGTEYYVKTSLMRDVTRYSDPDITLQADYRSRQHYSEAGWKYRTTLGNELLLFAPLQLSWILAAGEWHTQTRVALAGAWHGVAFNQRISYALSGRVERIDNTNIALPGANAAWRLNKLLTLKANVQQTYRVPSLNELYYFPGGNTGLKPEKGWSADGGMKVELSRGRLIVTHENSFFYRDINDWIIWLGGAIWTPHNIARVKSRGVETDNKLGLSLGRHLLTVTAHTAYIRSLVAESYAPGDASVGKQLPYTPVYNFRFGVGYACKGFNINYVHGYTGYRSVTADGSTYLTPYQTGSLQAAYVVKLNTHEAALNLQINNVWNERYYLIAARPLPGINWLGGLMVRW